MEQFIFRRPEVVRELEKTVEARLHTDGFGEPRFERVRDGERKPVHVLADFVLVPAGIVSKGHDDTGNRREIQ